MENEKLIAEIASMLKGQRQTIIEEMSLTLREQNQAMAEYIDERMGDLKTELRAEISGVKQEILFKIENDVEKRLDALTDGYKLTHEKQWELERKLGALETRLAALEEKIA